MSNLLNLFYNNVLPIFLAAGAGYALSRYLRLNPRTLSPVIFYIFSPCLVFNLIRTSKLQNNDIFRMIFFAVTVIVLVGLITYIIGRSHWLRGGFPLSFTARTEAASLAWRRQFLQTFLERDVPQLGITIPAVGLRRFWNMIAHYHAQTWNAA